MMRVLLVVLLVLPVVLLPACGGEKAPAGEGGSETAPGASAEPAGRPASQGPSIPLVAASSRVEAPDLGGRLIDGDASWSLADRKGRVVVVDFWATWCGPCRRSIPDLVGLQKDLAGRGLEVVGVSLDRPGSEEMIRAFSRQMGINYPVIHDGQGRFAQAYGGVQSIPTFFLIDREGRVAAQAIGLHPRETIERAITQLLAEG